MTQEERKRIEDACSTLYLGENYKGLYINLNHLLLSYSSLLAEHDPKFGDVSTDELSKNINTIEVLIRTIEPLITDDLFNRK